MSRARCQKCHDLPTTRWRNNRSGAERARRGGAPDFDPYNRPHVAPADSMTPTLAVLAILALAAFGAMGAVAGALWMKARSGAAALRQATEDRTRLLALADHWIWETDPAHRLTTLAAAGAPPGRLEGQPPAGRRAAPPSPLPLPGADGVSAASGRFARQLAAVAPARGACARSPSSACCCTWATAPARCGVVRGEPHHDGEGYFLGYWGTAKPVGESDAADFGQAALAGLLSQPDATVLALPPPRRKRAVAPRGPGRRHARAVRHDPLARGRVHRRARLGRRLRPPAGRHRPGARARCPRARRRAVGDWRVSWAFVASDGDAQAGRLVMLRKAAVGRRRPPCPPAPAVAEAVAPTPDATDHESFIYTVSHDLRAPIRVVEGFARILKEDYGRFLDRIGNDHTDRILAAAARMNSMIDSLLALSRLQSQPLKRQPVDLSQLTRYVLEDLRSNEPEREAEIHIEPGLVIQGDPTLMRIAIENLVGNAWKYSSQSPTTRIELRRETLAGIAHLRDRRRRRRLRHALRRPPVRRVPAAAQREGFPGHGRRPGVGAAHHPAPWRGHLGRVGGRPGRAVLFHVAVRRRRRLTTRCGRPLHRT